VDTLAHLRRHDRRRSPISKGGKTRRSRHWEADLLIFRRTHSQANVTPLVERRSRLTRLVPNHSRRSREVIGAIGQALASLPPMARQSITFDRGSEFLGYDELTRTHGIKAYLCDPHAPWQKGSIENTNGRLRRFLPGELDPSTLTPDHLRESERQMNDTPRKCLSFRTPQEAFAAALG
jgi:IS30 family transposase